MPLCLLKRFSQPHQSRPTLRFSTHRRRYHRRNVLSNAQLVQVRHRLGGDPQKLGHHIFATSPFERRVSGQRAEQGGAQAVDVCRGRRILTREDLWGHERRRPGKGTGGCLEPTGNPRETEIGQRQLTVIGQQDIARFHVPMQDAQALRALQGSSNLYAHPQNGLGRQRTLLADLPVLVHDPATLIVAFDRVASNRGARSPGIDGVPVADVEECIGIPGFLSDLRLSLKDGSFRPLAVRERKIPKPGAAGKVRRLGIPTVADRVVQAALKLVLEPIFEADFEPVSYGFRPNRRAQDAIAEIHYYSTRGYQWVL
jgi:hypothetical protein